MHVAREVSSSARGDVISLHDSHRGASGFTLYGRGLSPKPTNGYRHNRTTQRRGTHDAETRNRRLSAGSHLRLHLSRTRAPPHAARAAPARDGKTLKRQRATEEIRKTVSAGIPRRRVRHTDAAPRRGLVVIAVPRLCSPLTLIPAPPPRPTPNATRPSSVLSRLGPRRARARRPLLRRAALQLGRRLGRRALRPRKRLAHRRLLARPLGLGL